MIRNRGSKAARVAARLCGCKEVSVFAALRYKISNIEVVDRGRVLIQHAPGCACDVHATELVNLSCPCRDCREAVRILEERWDCGAWRFDGFANNPKARYSL